MLGYTVTQPGAKAIEQIYDLTIAFAVILMRRLELVDTLSQQLQRGLLEGVWSARETAQIMGMKPHTLRRRLKAKGTGFRQELDRVRMALSLQLLEGTNITVLEISGLMGYKNSSAFIRSFNRWTGTTPTQWRLGCR